MEEEGLVSIAATAAMGTVVLNSSNNSNNIEIPRTRATETEIEEEDVVEPGGTTHTIAVITLNGHNNNGTTLPTTATAIVNSNSSNSSSNPKHVHR